MGGGPRGAWLGGGGTAVGRGIPRPAPTAIWPVTLTLSRFQSPPHQNHGVDPGAKGGTWEGPASPQLT